MVAKGPWGKIYNGPISRSVYNAFFNACTKFCAFITKCTIVATFYAMPPHYRYTSILRTELTSPMLVMSSTVCPQLIWLSNREI